MLPGWIPSTRKTRRFASAFRNMAAKASQRFTAHPLRCGITARNTRPITMKKCWKPSRSGLICGARMFGICLISRAICAMRAACRGATTRASSRLTGKRARILSISIRRIGRKRRLSISVRAGSKSGRRKRCR